MGGFFVPKYMSRRGYRPDADGFEQGIYKHNRKILRNTSVVCAICGMPLDNTLKFPHPLSTSIDHIIPVSKGGRSTLDNLQATHLVCNQEKGKKILGKVVDAPKNENKKMLPQYIDWSNYKD